MDASLRQAARPFRVMGIVCAVAVLVGSGALLLFRPWQGGPAAETRLVGRFEVARNGAPLILPVRLKGCDRTLSMVVATGRPWTDYDTRLEQYLGEPSKRASFSGALVRSTDSNRGRGASHVHDAIQC